MKRVAIYGGSFNPPGIHHRLIAEAAAKIFDAVIILPCGPRPDKKTVGDIDPLHRAAMVDLAFRGISEKVRVELFDLENATFTRNHEFERIFGGAGCELWHIVGSDIVAGGVRGESLIHRVWRHGAELWRNVNFAVVLGRGVKLASEDFPPHHLAIEPVMHTSSTDIRRRAFEREDFSELVVPAVNEYIEHHGLYRGGISKTPVLSVQEPHLLIRADEWNSEALTLQSSLSDLVETKPPNLILVIGGDGTMLHAIRDLWRMRLPFLGVNLGHVGFLLNDVRREFSPEFLRRDFVLRHSPLLHIEMQTPAGERCETLAFNDVWTEAGHGKTGWFGIKIDNEVMLERIVGSGILAATPAGSTGYARAMGAAPLPITANLLTIVGSNVAQPIGWRGLGLPMESVVEFYNADDTGRRKIFGFADGVPLGEIRKMRVRVSRIAAVEIAFAPEYDLMRKLRTLQFPK